MGQTKEILQAGPAAFGGWSMIGHPTVAEILAGQGFDWPGRDSWVKKCKEKSILSIHTFPPECFSI